MFQHFTSSHRTTDTLPASGITISVTATTHTCDLHLPSRYWCTARSLVVVASPKIMSNNVKIHSTSSVSPEQILSVRSQILNFTNLGGQTSNPSKTAYIVLKVVDVLVCYRTGHYLDMPITNGSTVHDIIFICLLQK